MKILVLDKTQTHADPICQNIDLLGHSSKVVLGWEDAIKTIKKTEYSIVFLDYSFLQEGRHHISDIRRASRGYIYVIGMNVDVDENDIELGFNTTLLTLEALRETLYMASLFVLRFNQLGNNEEDFPSAGGVVSKSAFNQLFLSTMDCTRRDGKGAYVLFFSVENYKNIMVEESEYSARHATARLAYHLSQTRRQSDILAQTGDNEYAILFLRPEYEKEPIEATNRFVKTLSDIKDYTTGLISVDIALNLYALPSGHLHTEYSFTVQGIAA